MERIKNQTHSKETFLLASSRTLERGAYYGLRTIIVLHMLGEVLKMESVEALNIYGWFIGALLFSQIIGAIVGDLLIGNKKAFIIGALLQALGAFSFCIPSTAGLYIGLLLVILGGGFYTPNILSAFGKLYLNKTKLLDAGFTIFYFAASLGAFVGVLSISYIGDNSSLNMGFITAGILMLLSIIPMLFYTQKETQSVAEKTVKIHWQIIYVFLGLIFFGLFWATYELGSIRLFDLELKFSEISTLNISRSTFSSLNSFFILPISIFVIILWTLFYNHTFFKLIIGFLFGTLFFGTLFLIPEFPSEHHIIPFLLAFLFLSIAEIHIAPSVYTILTKYANQKYLAILMSLSFVPPRLLIFSTHLFDETLNEQPMIGMTIGLIIMIISSILLLVFSKAVKLR